MKYYAVAEGKTIGVFNSWNDCEKSVLGYKNAIHKKFNTKEEAEKFIQSNKTCKPTIKKIDNIIEFFAIEKSSKLQCNHDNSESEYDIFTPDYYIYTDGSCSNNGHENAQAGIGIFFGINDPRNVSRKIEGKQTNNIAELSAIIQTYSIIEKDVSNAKKITIVSDSEYAIKCVTTYGEKCNKKNWDIDIPNKELVKQAYEIYKDKKNIQFMHVKAHTNSKDIHSIGNENADKLANIAIN